MVWMIPKNVSTVEQAKDEPQLGLKCRVVQMRNGLYKTQFRLLFIWHDSNIVRPMSGLDGLAVHTAYVANQNRKPPKGANKIKAIIYP